MPLAAQDAGLGGGRGRGRGPPGRTGGGACGESAEKATEYSRALAGVAARLAEACATHTRMVADLEARAERAAEE